MILIRFGGRKETEHDLRLIFEHYGVIEDILIKAETALISFKDEESAVCYDRRVGVILCIVCVCVCVFVDVSGANSLHRHTFFGPLGTSVPRHLLSSHNQALESETQR